MTVIDWLLDSDPAIRWQVMRDLTHEPADVVAAERARVATEGWGARLLALQAPDGRWGGTAVVAGLDGHVPRPGAAAAVRARSRRASRPGARSRSSASTSSGGIRDFETPWADNRFFEGEVEPCINGNVVATGSYFGVDMAPLVDRLLGEQLAGRRLELRGRERRHGVVVRDDDQRARGPARARAGDRRLGRRCARRAGAARSTCSSAGCSVGSRPAR